VSVPSPIITADDSGLQPFVIREQLDRILNSPEFKATNTQKAFLKYVVEKKLAGQAAGIKGYTVATEVFGRGEDFDQTTDPIVSIQANRLRWALERYYLVTGKNDPICIDIPKGTYVPVFQKQEIITQVQSVPQSRGARSGYTGTWPTILIESLENLTGKPELEYMGVGIATEIALEITRYQEIRVVRQGVNRSRKDSCNIRFVLCGYIKQEMSGLKVIVSLIDQSTGIQIWGDAHRIDFNPAEMSGFEERIASGIVSKISCENGVIPKLLSRESKRIPPEKVTTYQGLLRFYRFLDDFSPDSFAGALAALEQGCINEPECGLIWSMLARLYSINYSMELFDVQTPLDEAYKFAQKGLIFAPSDQRVRMVMAFVLLFKNELSAGLSQVDYALQLNPNSLISLENIGYLLTLLGDWEQGPLLINQAMSANPYYNVNVHYALWVNWVRQEKYEQAYEETLHFNQPLLFWDPVLKTASFGLLGRVEEAIQAGKNILACKPDFAERGRVLIQHYIKFDDVVQRVIMGLEKAGIRIA